MQFVAKKTEILPKLGALFMFVFLMFSLIIPTNAEYIEGMRMHDSRLTTAQDEAEYFARYINTGPAPAEGYFEVYLVKTLGDLDIEEGLIVTSITDTYPVDIDGNPLEDAKTVNIAVEDALYYETNEEGEKFLKIRVSPQSECVKREEIGGCEDGVIPDEVLGKLTVKVKFAEGVTDSAVYAGAGQLFFPHGYDSTPISWKININNANEEGTTLPQIEGSNMQETYVNFVDEFVNGKEEVIVEEKTSESEKDDDEDLIKLAMWVGSGVLAGAVIVLIAYLVIRKNSNK